jgi:hypothetical protein
MSGGPKPTLCYEFAYDAGGKGCIGTLFVDDRQVAQTRIDKTVPFIRICRNFSFATNMEYDLPL